MDTPTGVTHDGKAVYFGPMDGHLVEATRAYPQPATISPAELSSLQQSHAFELPSRAVRDCFTDNFFRYCYPWAPVVEPSWLIETPGQKPSALLVQAVLLAGSRVTSPNDLAIRQEVYQRVKALFFSNYETNPVRRVITCLLLRWWCPAGQDRVCIDSNHFWIGTGVRLAVAIGLNTESSNPRDASYRRRLWWSLKISTVHGWPSSISRDGHSVALPHARDFSRNPSSIAFITISRIFGDIGLTYRRKERTAASMERLQNALYVWIRELPDRLRLFNLKHPMGLMPYNFEARQLHVLFFVNVILLFRQHSTAVSESLSVESLVAASFVAGLYEEFLIRDDVSHLGLAIQKFLLLTTGMTLLSARRAPTLAGLAAKDYNTILKALEQFSTRYPSTMGTISTLRKMEASQAHAGAPGHSVTIIPRQTNVPSLFREFGPNLCNLWHLMDITRPIVHKHEMAVHEEGYGALSSVKGYHDPAAGADAGQLLSNQAVDLQGQVFGMGQPYDSTCNEGDTLWPYTFAAVPDPSDWILECMPFDLDSVSPPTMAGGG